MSTCQHCGGLPLYYNDTTNGTRLCRTCHAGELEGRLNPDDRRSTMETFDLSPPETRAIAAKAQADTLGSALLSFQVTSAELDAQAIATAKQVKAARVQLEDERDSAVKPLSAVVARIRGWFKPPIESLEKIERHLKQQSQAWAIAEKARATAALVEATSSEEVERAASALTVRTPGRGTQTRWAARVVVTPEETRAKLLELATRLPSQYGVELAAILHAAIPAEYLIVNLAALNKVAIEKHAAFAIPGAEAFATESVVLR